MNERRAISQAALRWNRQHLPRTPWRPSRLAIYTLKDMYGQRMPS